MNKAKTPNKRFVDALGYMFNSENTRPVLILVTVCLLILMLVYGLKKLADTVDQEISDLVKHGRLVHAEIVDFKPYSYVTRAGKSGRGYEHRGIDVVIKYEALNDQVIYEDWDYDLKDKYKVGDNIDLYLLEKNFWIKAASTHRRSGAYRSQMEADLLRSRMGPSES